jgi:hypothetical protein
VTGASDIPLIRPFSRAGYRPLLEAGIRVFDWNGSMIHAKTAVADGLWARVGSTNLNIASWLGNRELYVIVEDEPFAREMEDLYDLRNATEVVLQRNRVRAPGAPSRRHGPTTSGGGSGGRVAAGAVRVGNTDCGGSHQHARSGVRRGKYCADRRSDLRPDRRDCVQVPAWYRVPDRRIRRMAGSCDSVPWTPVVSPSTPNQE